jgi:hypothetical protein
MIDSLALEFPFFASVDIPKQDVGVRRCNINSFTVDCHRLATEFAILCVFT